MAIRLMGVVLLLAGTSAWGLDAPSVLSRTIWVEEGEHATVEAVTTRLASRFKADAPGTVYPLGPGKTLWIKLRLQGTSVLDEDWELDIAMPLLDSATLYQRSADGLWASQIAGDRLDVASWSRPGRYPSFQMTLPHGVMREMVLQVRHRDPIGFVLRMGTSPQLEQVHLFEYLLMGAVLGTLLLLVVYCLIQSVIYRDRTYAWYALYGATMTLTVTAIAGIGGHLLWPRLPDWNDMAKGLMPMLLAAVNILFVRNLCAIAPRYPWTDRLTLAVAFLVLLLCMAFPFTMTTWQSGVVALSLLSSTVMTLLLASLAWRRGDSVGGWVLFAYLPLAFAVVLIVLRLFGYLTASWLNYDGSSVAAALAVPLLLIAVNARSRDRHGAITRVNKLTEQDALTGLLSPAAFERQLKSTVSGAMMRKEAAAVVMIEVANLAEIRQAYGDAMAEQCLLRAVVKLYRLARDGDPVGRIETGRFGMILEGVRERAALQEKLVQLMASGLAPSRGANFSIPLQFHIAGVLLSERLRTHVLIQRDLGRLLSSMSSRTRRPIRFLEPDRSSPAKRQPDSLQAASEALENGSSGLPSRTGPSSRPGLSDKAEGP